MGAQPRRAGARLPQHGDRRRARAARRGRRRPDLGQRRAAQLHVGVGHRVLAAPRLVVAARHAARVGQPGADDVLLPRRRPRGQARARPRRAARAPAPGAARGRRHRRRRRRHHRLPGHQRGRSGCARLGHGHVHRHRVRARHPRPDRAPGRAPARVPALARRGRRPHRAGRAGGGLHDGHLGHRPGGRGGAVRGHRAAALRPLPRAPARGGRARGRDVDRHVQVRHRPGGVGARRRARAERLRARARGPRAGHRAVALVPRAADAGARAARAAERGLGDLPERAPAVRPAPVDQLPDRAGVRAGQRRDRVQLEPALRRRHLADHHRHRCRLRPRQAAGHPHLVLAGHPPAHAQPAPAHQLADPLRAAPPWPESGSRSRC